MYGSLKEPADGETEAKAHFRAKCLACVLSLCTVGEGYDWSVMNGAAVLIKDEFSCSTLQIAIMISMTPLGVMCGTVVGGQLGDFLGRRPTLLACFAALVVAPLAMALAGTMAFLIGLRFCVGVGIGMGFILVSTYLTEVCPVAMRGPLTALQEVFLNVGLVLGYVSNWALKGVQNDWRWMIGLGAALPLLAFVLMLFHFVPESPRWLFLHGRQAEAMEVLTSFVGYAEADAACDAMRKELELKGQGAASWVDLFRACEYPPKRRALAAALAIAVAQTASGYLGLTYFSSTMFRTSMGESVAFQATVLMGIVKLLVCVVVVCVLERVGRRPMILASLSITTVSSALLGLSFALSWGWHAQAGFVCLFMAGFSLGLGPLTFIYIAEAFSNELRAKGMALALFISRTVGVSNVLSFPLLVEAVGVPLVLYGQCASNALALLAAWLLVRETHGRTLEGMGAIWDGP